MVPHWFRRVAAFVILPFVILTSATLGRPLPSVLEEMSLATQREESAIGPLTAETKSLISRPLYNTGEYVLTLVQRSLRWLGGGGSDCWGWTAPDGTDYAIVGVRSGLAFVDVTSGITVASLDGPEDGVCGGAYWRDMATMGHYCYCVSECSGTNEGLLVIDLQFLPDSVHLVSIPSSGTSHNLSIDSLKGYLYIEGSNFESTGVHIFDLADPENPVKVGSFGSTGGIHDLYVINDTAYLAEGFGGNLSIWDVSNKTSPVKIAGISIPSGGYAHNVWPTRDHNFLVSTEETPDRTVKIWDISDLANIQLMGEYLGPSRLAHNAQVEGDTVYLSHYESGVRILDISDPENPMELASFDTWPTDNPDYNGAWGVFANPKSGLVYASNGSGLLYILEATPHLLTDSISASASLGAPGFPVRVDISISNSLDLTQITFPISWNGPFDMTFDSASTTGLRTDYFDLKELVALDETNNRLAFRLDVGQAASLPPGDDKVISLYFTVNGGIESDINPIRFTPFNGIDTRCISPAADYAPDTEPGSVTISAEACCQGIRGNVSGDPGQIIDIEDLTYMVAYMFGGGPEPLCPGEANMNGDPQGTIDISDLTALVSYMFGGGASPSDCPF